MLKNLALATAAFMIASGANATTTFFAESYTGATLQSDPDVEVFGPSMLTGQRLDLTVLTSGTPILQFGILDAGNYATVDIDIIFDFENPSLTNTDMDVFFALWDGTTAVGVNRLDNSGGSLNMLSGFFSGAGLSQQTAQSFRSGIGPNSSLTWDFSIDGPTGTVNGSATENGQTSSVSPSPFTHDLTNGLDLVLITGTVSEEYGIISIDITVSGSIAAVPVPAGLPLLVGALGAAALLRRSRRS